MAWHAAGFRSSGIGLECRRPTPGPLAWRRGPAPNTLRIPNLQPETVLQRFGHHRMHFEWIVPLSNCTRRSPQGGCAAQVGGSACILDLCSRASPRTLALRVAYTAATILNTLRALSGFGLGLWVVFALLAGCGGKTFSLGTGGAGGQASDVLIVGFAGAGSGEFGGNSGGGGAGAGGAIATAGATAFDGLGGSSGTAARSGEAGSGEAGSGEAGSGEAGSGEAGSGAAGGGAAGGGAAGGGAAGGGAAGGGAAGSGGEAGSAGRIGPVGSGSEAVTFRINPAHSGAQLGDRLRLPLQARWSRSFDRSFSNYPLVAGGRVFVTVPDPLAPQVNLFALDAQVGTLLWGPVGLGGTYRSAVPAYDNGRIFTTNYDGRIAAYDAITGQMIWDRFLNLRDLGAPVATNGRLYFVGGRSLFVLDQRNGDIVWSRMIGDDVGPTVTPTGIYLASGCINAQDGIHAQALRVEDGQTLWQHGSVCAGLSQGLPLAFGDGLLYSRRFYDDDDLILDSVTGQSVGSMPTDTIPAIADGMVYVVKSGVLSATPVGESAPAWSFGDGDLYSAPVVVGNTVVVVSDTGHISVLRSSDGTVVSQDRLPAGHSLDGDLVAADDKLFVLALNKLVVY